MRMRLVYLTCALLWLVMSALIGMSFVSRSVFNAEQGFNAFDQRLFEQLGQKLQANEVVLDSYAAFCAQAGSSTAETAFTRRLLEDNQQIVDLVRLDGQSLRVTGVHLLRKSDVSLPVSISLIQSLAKSAKARSGSAVSLPFLGSRGEEAYVMVRTVDGPGQGLVAMVVDANALLPRVARLPNGGALLLWHTSSPVGGGWWLRRASGARTSIENVLFPRLAFTRPIGSSAQPLMVNVSWQLGFSEIDLTECIIAAALSLALLAIILVGITSYARFLAGSQERELRLFYLANHDRLTSLANRNLFYDRLQHAISRLNRNGRNLAVLFLDMDRFKPVNDTYGHAMGDRVLQMISARLKVELRGEDTVARLGGDEFVVLLEDVESKEEVNQVVERLKLAIERSYQIGEHCIQLGVSIGVAYYPEDGVLIEELLSVADRKMYGEKNEPALVV